MQKGIIYKALEKERKKDEERKIRIQKTVILFSKLSGIGNIKRFEPKSPNDLYLKKESLFLNGISYSELDNINGVFKGINPLISIMDFLEVNFKIRLNYELSDFEKENYINKIKNIVLSRYYLISKADSDDWLKGYTMHKYCEHILNIWTQLETDLIYQISNFKEPNSTIKDILKNEIENKVNLWSYTYIHYYKSYGNYLNEIIMTYPPADIREELLKKKDTNKPYAKDLMENKEKLNEFRKKMNDTSFWSSVLECFYEEKTGKLVEEIEFIFKPALKEKEIKIREFKDKLKPKKENEIIPLEPFASIDGLAWDKITITMGYRYENEIHIKTDKYERKCNYKDFCFKSSNNKSLELIKLFCIYPDGLDDKFIKYNLKIKSPTSKKIVNNWAQHFKKLFSIDTKPYEVIKEKIPKTNKYKIFYKPLITFRFDKNIKDYKGRKPSHTPYNDGMNSPQEQLSEEEEKDQEINNIHKYYHGDDET